MSNLLSNQNTVCSPRGIQLAWGPGDVALCGLVSFRVDVCSCIKGCKAYPGHLHAYMP